MASDAVRTSGFLPWIELPWLGADFRIQSYFVVVSVVLCAIALWIPKRAARRDLPGRTALDIFIVGMIGGGIGSRLLHIFWEEPGYYLEDPMRAFDIVSGGFVWYGGLIGTIVACVTLLKLRKDSFIAQWFDFFAPIAAFGYAGGRLACVLTGCCYGRICEWPIGQHSHFYLPSQIFAVVWETAAGLILIRLERQRSPFETGGLFELWLIFHGVGRIIMELMREDPRGPHMGPITISMVVSLVLIAVGAALIGKNHARIRDPKAV